jgi:hypothetical protein
MFFTKYAPVLSPAFPPALIFAHSFINLHTGYFLIVHTLTIKAPVIFLFTYNAMYLYTIYLLLEELQAGF